jgi:hypothetical protein
LLLDDLSNFFLDDDLNHNVQYEEEIWLTGGTIQLFSD